MMRRGSGSARTKEAAGQKNVFGGFGLLITVLLVFVPVLLGSAPVLAVAAEGNADDDANDVVEAAIAVDASSPSASESSQAARSGAANGAKSTSSSADTSENTQDSDDQTEVSTDFGLPADSPLFSGIEEDVEVESSKSSETADEKRAESGAGGALSSNSSDGAAENSEADSATIMVVPDEEWREHGNAVIPLQLPDSSFIYDTSIQELSNADPYLDNQTVQVTGEAIGESIRASILGRSRWVTLSPVGDSATVSVFMSEESAAKIDSFGRYGVRGSILRVRGTFYLVCPEHDGATDLHAEEVTVVKPGESVHESFKVQAFVPGLILVVVGLVMVFVFSHISERRR